MACLILVVIFFFTVNFNFPIYIHNHYAVFILTVNGDVHRSIRREFMEHNLYKFVGNISFFTYPIIAILFSEIYLPG